MYRKQKIYTASADLGLVAAALATNSPVIPEQIQPGSTYTNCPSPLEGCWSYSRRVQIIDPFCCSENATTCWEYSVEIWQCSAGGTRYRNFKQVRSLAGSNCDSLSAACY